jgi:hypothetical protein
MIRSYLGKYAQFGVKFSREAHVQNVLLLVAVLGGVAVAALWWVVIGHNPALGAASWLVQSQPYKAEVLALPGTTNGELKHIEPGLVILYSC